MERTELVKVLGRTSAALMTGKDDEQPFKSVFFDGEKARAYDDEIYVEVPCELAVKGGIDGKFLKVWAGGCSGVEIKVADFDNGTVTRWTCGRSTVRTPTLSDDTLVYERPTDKPFKVGNAKKDLVESLKRVSISMGDDDSHANTSGVTMRVTSEGTTLYATNNWTLARTLSAAKLLIKKGKPRDVLIPARFVELVISFAKGDKLTSFVVGEGWQEATFESGVVLWGKGSQGEPDVAAFERVMEKALPDESDEFQTAEIPKGLNVAMSRLGSVLALSTEKIATVEVTKGKIILKGKTAMGEVDERIALKDHPDVEAQTFAPSLTRKAFEHAEQIRVGDMLVLMSANFLYVQAMVQVAE